jgi:hypothetical protein
MDDFITVYLNQTDDNGPTLQNKQQLLEEIALFSLASHMFWGIWGIVNINQEIEFGYWVSFHLSKSNVINQSSTHYVSFHFRNTQIFESTNISPPKKNILN